MSHPFADESIAIHHDLVTAGGDGGPSGSAKYTAQSGEKEGAGKGSVNSHILGGVVF
jgi:hypothetical protein